MDKEKYFEEISELLKRKFNEIERFTLTDQDTIEKDKDVLKCLKTSVNETLEIIHNNMSLMYIEDFNSLKNEIFNSIEEIDDFCEREYDRVQSLKEYLFELESLVSCIIKIEL